MRFERGLYPFLNQNIIRHGFTSDDDTDMPRYGLLINDRFDTYIEDDLEFVSPTEQPELIKIRATLQPHMHTHTLHGVYTYRGVACTPCPLLNDNVSIIVAMDVVFSKQGAFFKKGCWEDFTDAIEADDVRSEPKKHAIVYRKYFSSFKTDIAVDATLSTKPGYHGLLFSYTGGDTLHDHPEIFEHPSQLTPPISEDLIHKSRPIWGYGGYYAPHTKIENIMPHHLTRVL